MTKKTFLINTPYDPMSQADGIQLQTALDRRLDDSMQIKLGTDFFYAFCFVPIKRGNTYCMQPFGLDIEGV